MKDISYALIAICKADLFSINKAQNSFKWEIIIIISPIKIISPSCEILSKYQCLFISLLINSFINLLDVLENQSFTIEIFLWSGIYFIALQVLFMNKNKNVV